MKRSEMFISAGLILLLVTVAGCAPGNERWNQEINPGHEAGFWAGLWHGLICVITFVISLFTNKVQMYEINNAGGWYNLGFLIGAACFFGGSWSSHRKKRKSIREREWDEIGRKVEEKVRRGIQNWLKESEGEDKDWDEIAEKVEEKIKRELRDWAEK